MHRGQPQRQAAATRATGQTTPKMVVPPLPRQQPLLAPATTTREAGTTTVAGTEITAGWVPISRSRSTLEVDVYGRRR